MTLPPGLAQQPRPRQNRSPHFQLPRWFCPWFHPWLHQRRQSRLPPANPAMAPVAAQPRPLPAPEGQTAKEPPATEERKEQVISARRGDSIFLLARRYYRASNETLADLILEANPGIINIHRIVIGQKIKIPAEITDESLILPAPEGGYRIYLGTFARRGAASIFEEEPGLDGKKFEIIQKDGFPRGVLVQSPGRGF